MKMRFPAITGSGFAWRKLRRHRGRRTLREKWRAASLSWVEVAIESPAGRILDQAIWGSAPNASWGLRVGWPSAMSWRDVTTAC